MPIKKDIQPATNEVPALEVVALPLVTFEISFNYISAKITQQIETLNQKEKAQVLGIIEGSLQEIVTYLSSGNKLFIPLFDIENSIRSCEIETEVGRLTKKILSSIYLDLNDFSRLSFTEKVKLSKSLLELVKTLQLNTSSESELTESKEVSARDLADSVQYVVTHGKVGALAGPMEGMNLGFHDLADFSTIAYTRKTSSQESADSGIPFSISSINRSQDSHNHLVNILGQWSDSDQSVDALFKLGNNKYALLQEGQVALRYQTREGSTGKNLVFTLAMKLKSPYSPDPRSSGRASYVSFELPFDKGKQFLESAIVNPSFIGYFLIELFRNNTQIVGHFDYPKFVVCATRPGLDAFWLRNKEGVSKTEPIVPHMDVEGNFFISGDGKQMNPSLNTPTPLPQDNLLQELGIEF